MVGVVGRDVQVLGSTQPVVWLLPAFLSNMEWEFSPFPTPCDPPRWFKLEFMSLCRAGHGVPERVLSAFNESGRIERWGGREIVGNPFREDSR